MQPSFANHLGIEFVWIEPGTFLMGAEDTDVDAEENERPCHRVTIRHGFYMARTPVTLGQYRQFHPFEEREYGAWDDEHAVNYISCDAADSWVMVLNESRLPSDYSKTYRLPTEAEWAYACRAGTRTRFHFGDDPEFLQLGEYAWFAGNTWDINHKHPQRVGKKKPNAFGLYDVHGNVWEWTSDGWALYDDILSKGESVRVRELRVLRGGGWCHEGKYHRASDRDFYEPSYKHYYTGFRLCCDVTADREEYQGGEHDSSDDRARRRTGK